MIDTHCHLADPQFKKDLKDAIVRARHAGLQKIINAGYDVATSRSVIELNRTENWILPAVGIHPNEVAEESIKQFRAIEDMIRTGTVIAIGETGLDYYRTVTLPDAQQELFRLHVQCSRAFNLPLLIHTRNSVHDAVRILKVSDCHNGVFHCYTGSYEQAMEIIDMGFYLGFGGMLTFSKKTREVFRKIPEHRIVLETDAPFLSPASHRGQRNEPSFITETLRTAAEIFEKTPEYMEQMVDANAKALFSL